jgi:hypothetical protein
LSPFFCLFAVSSSDTVFVPTYRHGIMASDVFIFYT